MAACTQMALQHIHIHQSQPQLNQLLGLSETGVPAARVRRLSRLGVSVIYTTGDETALRTAIDRGLPPIVFLSTGDLPYWQSNLRHAVLVVGYDDAAVYLNDPVFGEASQQVSWGDFMLAWSEFDYRYALLVAPESEK